MTEHNYTTLAECLPVILRQIGTDSISTVNGRHLHAWLCVKKDYSDWMKAQIKRAKLFEYMDFEVFPLEGENPLGGRPALEYALSLDAAKRIAMMSSADKGHEVRTYFLECERRAHALQQPKIPVVKDPAIQMLIDMAVHLDEARTLAQEAKQEATYASANADRALRSQLFFTVAEYVYVNTLASQLPASAYRACGDHLEMYCNHHAIPWRYNAIGGKPWQKERSFPGQVFAEILPGWLKRRFAQDHLRVIEMSPQPTPVKE